MRLEQRLSIARAELRRTPSRCICAWLGLTGLDQIRRHRDVASAAKNAAALSLRRAAPHAVLDAVHECVLETFGADRALSAHPLRSFDSGSVRREEVSGADPATTRVKHPRVLVRGFLHWHLHFYEPYGALVPAVRFEPVRFTTFRRRKTLPGRLLSFL